jgi:hypothetical protein
LPLPGKLSKLGFSEVQWDYVRFPDVPQIDAVYAAGLQEWVLWHPGSNYTVEALARSDGTAPTFGRPAELPAPTPARPARTAPLGTPVSGG